MSTRRYAVLAALVAASLAGCAVAKIDVDVYKGPLANQEEIRLQQFVVLASAAKPFLVRLRDSLEWANCSEARVARAPILPDSELGQKTKGLRLYLEEQCRSKLSLSPDQLARRIAQYDLADYEPDYMPDHRWRNIKAERVNSILSLYKDRTEPELQDFTAAVMPAYRQYDDATWTLEYHRDPELWSRIEKDIKADQRDTPLAKAYRLLLDPTYEPKNFRRGGALQKLKEKEPALKNAHLIDNVFAYLESSPAVATDARALFTDPAGDSARQFVAASIGYARSFREARESLEAIWKEANRTLITLDRLALPQGAEQQEKRNRLTRGLAALIGQTTQAEFANYALCQAGGPASFVVLHRELQAEDPRVPWSGTEPWVDPTWQRARDAVELRLRAAPQRNAQILLEAHQRLKDQRLKDQPDSATPRGCRKPPSWTLPDVTPPYGLVRGPTTGTGLNAPDIDLAGLLGAAGVGLANGLEHARGPEGIERLADRYIEISRPDRNAGPRAVAAARELLTTTLVGFAEKVAFVANHDVLEADGGKPGGAVDRYRVILQAIGNALMVQADDLKRVALHQKGQSDRAEAERWALEHAIGRSAEAFLLSLVADARQDAQKAATAEEQAQAAYAKAKTDLETKTAANTEAQRLKGERAAATSPNVARPKYATVKKVHGVLSTHAVALKTALGDDPGNGAATLTQLTALLQSYSQDAKDTASYLDSGEIKTSITGISAKAKKAVFDDIVNLVTVQLGVAKSFADEEDAAAQQVAKRKQAADTDAANKQKDLQEATAAEARTKGEWEKKKGEAETAKTLADTIAGYQVALARQTGGGARSPYDGYQDIREANDKALTAAKAKTPPDAVAVAKLEAAKKFIDGHNPPLSLSRVPAASTRTGENARDVLDSLIMSLRDEHILTIRESGEDSARAKSVAASLKAAYDHRGGMAYLRPAIAYLRSSYAATSLQDDSGAAGWKNLLDESRNRSMPFISEGLANSGKEEKLKITSEIDKQFWQTINSVRVSGAGLTNYVMVKDDIGNWYVKQYSADPTSLINSAKALAMFNLGVPSAPSPTPPADPANPAPANPAGAPAPEASGPLDRLLKRHKENYGTQTASAYENAVKLAETLSARISAAWDADKDLAGVREKLAAQLDVEKKTLIADLDKLKTDKAEAQGAAIVGALHAGRRFHNRLVTAIRINLKGESEATAASKAPEYVTLASRDVLAEAARSRKESVSEYSRSITFIGDANK